MDKEMAHPVGEIVSQIKRSLLGRQGTIDQDMTVRLGKVVSTLLEFWSEKRVLAWMLKKNPELRGNAPLDLVYSNYATDDLFRAISEIKRKYKSRKAGNRRLRRLLRTPSVLEIDAGRVPLREKLRGEMVDPGEPPNNPHNRPSDDCRAS